MIHETSSITKTTITSTFLLQSDSVDAWHCLLKASTEGALFIDLCTICITYLQFICSPDDGISSVGRYSSSSCVHTHYALWSEHTDGNLANRARFPSLSEWYHKRSRGENVRFDTSSVTKKLLSLEIFLAVHQGTWKKAFRTAFFSFPLSIHVPVKRFECPHCGGSPEDWLLRLLLDLHLQTLFWWPVDEVN